MSGNNLQLTSMLSKDYSETEDDFSTNGSLLHNPSQQESCFKIKYYWRKFKFKWKTNRLLRFIVTTSLCTITLFWSFYFFALHISGICPQDQFPVDDDCIDMLIDALPRWVSSIFISASIIVLIIMLSVYRVVHYVNGIISVGVSMILVFAVHGPLNVGKITLRDFSIGHSLALILFIALEIIFILYILLTISLFNRFKRCFLVFVGVQLYFIIKFYIIAAKSCDGWEKGLVHDLDYSDEYCIIKQPSLCWPNILDNTFNMGPDTCEIAEEKILQYKIDTLKNYKLIEKDTSKSDAEEVVKDINYIGWPLTNQMPSLNRNSEVEISDYLVNNVKIYDKEEDAYKDGSEVTVDLQNLDLNINIKRNQKLVNERKKKDVDSSLAKNIIVIYIDTVSRTQNYRKLKKTMSFLRRYADFDGESYEQEDLGSKLFESFRFHSIDRKTQDNVFKLRYNMQTKDWKSGRIKLDENNKKTSVLNDIKNAGYIFSHATNSLSIKSHLRGFTYNDQPIGKFFEDDPGDHEMYMFDPNYLFSENTFGVSKGANSVYRRCVYNKDTNYYVFDYGKKFLDAYKDDKKFLLLEFTDSHELTSEIVQYMDDNMYNFLINLEKKGFMDNDTALFMLSDHGQHLVSNYQPFQAFQTEKQKEQEVYTIERVLPFFFTSLTNDIFKKNKNLQKTLQTNEQRIFGMGEVRNTLLTTAYGLDYEYNYPKEMAQTNYNLFKELPIDRSCLDIGMNDLPHPFQYCSCKPHGDYNKLREEKIREQEEREKDWNSNSKQKSEI